MTVAISTSATLEIDPRFDHSEVRSLLSMLGAPRRQPFKDDEVAPVDL